MKRIKKCHPPPGRDPPKMLNVWIPQPENYFLIRLWGINVFPAFWVDEMTHIWVSREMTHIWVSREMTHIWVSREVTHIWVSREMTHIWVSHEADQIYGSAVG